MHPPLFIMQLDGLSVLQIEVHAAGEVAWSAGHPNALNAYQAPGRLDKNFKVEFQGYPVR